MLKKNWQLELEEYIRQGEPGQVEKSEAWQSAIGLQAVNGLKTSAYLLDTAKQHIEGKIKIEEAQKRIQSYYELNGDRAKAESGTLTADMTAVRIAELLCEKTFHFSPVEWIAIHRRIFEGVFDHAGQIRNKIRDVLDYEFAAERQFSYAGLSADAAVKHLAKFTSDIWRIHPFSEGNTIATAVFMIRYMKTLGFRLNCDVLEKSSGYFRNALVRANCNDVENGVRVTMKFLELFFSNLLMGTSYELSEVKVREKDVEEKLLI